MTTTLDSFDTSPCEAFFQSPLIDARNEFLESFGLFGGSSVDPDGAWAYSAVQNVWRSLKNIPFNIRSHVAFNIEQIVYLSYGYWVVEFTRNTAYSLQTNSYTSKATASSPARYNLGGVGIDGKGFCYFGDTGTSDSSDLDIYNPASDSWSAGGNGGKSREQIYAAYTNNAYAYAFAGIDIGVIELRFSERYYSGGSSWSTITDTPTPTRRTGAGAQMVYSDTSERCFIIAGRSVSGGGADIGNVDSYNPDTNAWLTSPPDISAMQQAQAVSVDTKIYNMGGTTSGGINSKTIKAYEPEYGSSWLSLQAIPVTSKQAGVAAFEEQHA
jgi:hypothetical protein